MEKVIVHVEGDKLKRAVGTFELCADFECSHCGCVFSFYVDNRTVVEYGVYDQECLSDPVPGVMRHACPNCSRWVNSKHVSKRKRFGV